MYILPPTSQLKNINSQKQYNNLNQKTPMSREEETSKSDSSIRNRKTTAEPESRKKHIKSINEFQLIAEKCKHLNKRIQHREKHQNQGW